MVRLLLAVALALMLPSLSSCAAPGKQQQQPLEEAQQQPLGEADDSLLASLRSKIRGGVALNNEDASKLLVVLAEQLLSEQDDLRSELKDFQERTHLTLSGHAEEHLRTRRSLAGLATKKKKKGKKEK
jgi:hypothetical protein